MVFDNSQNFIYTGTGQVWEKPVGVTTIWVDTYGGGGAGSSVNASGGGGAYVFSNYRFLQADISYNIIVNVGGGGKAPPTKTGGISVGGYLDPSGIKQTNGGSGTTLSGASSGGGGAMTSLFYLDPSNNEIIKIIAGGGGGAGSVNGSNGGSSGNYGTPVNNNTAFSSIGSNGSGVGGGQGGNTSLIGNAGLGGLSGGVNGQDFIDSSGAYMFIGGGGGNGGTFAGGGGGAGYGGAAGGKGGGGGGGGSFTNGNITSFILGGNAGGLPGQNGNDGRVLIQWNNQILVLPDPVVREFMLDSQHTCRSIYTASPLKPTSVQSYSPFSSAGISNPNSVVISSDSEIYGIGGDGALYAFDHNFTFRWKFSIPDYPFFGTPAITSDGTMYVSATTNLADKYFYAIVDNINNGSVKWQYKLNDGNPSTSPVVDLSGHIFFGTDGGYVYALRDSASQGILGWRFQQTTDPVSGTPVFDLSYDKLCYTTSDYTSPSSSIYVIDVSRNSVLNQITPTLRWSNTITGGDGFYSTPSVGKSSIYVNSTGGYVYSYDISNNGTLNWPVPINISDISLSNIAIGNDDRIYFTSQNSLNVIDSSNGILEWKYPIDPSGASVPDNSIPMIDSSNNVLFGTRSNYLYSINGAQRKVNWRYEVGGAIQAMPVLGNNNNIYVGANNATMYDLSGNGPPIIITTPIVSMYMLNVRHTGLSSYVAPITTPSINWSTDFVSGNLFVSPSISIGSDGTLYLGSNDGYVYAYKTPQTTPKWYNRVNNTDRVPFTSPNSMYTTPAIAPDGTIYIGSNEGYLFALDPSGGQLKWKYNAGYPLQSSPILDMSGSIYFGAGNKVYAIGDGEFEGYPKWLTPFATNANVNSSPALGTNGYLYFGSDDGYVYSIDSFTGTLIWAFDASGNTGGVHPIYTSASIDSSDNVIIGTGSYMNGVLYYLDGLTGIPIWSNDYSVITNTLTGPFYNTVAINGDTIYLSTIAYVYAIDRLTGTKKWYYYNTNCYYTSPVIDANGKLIFASIKAKDIGGFNKNGGILHSLTDNGSSFTENWAIQVCSPGRLAPPVLGDDGTIYISGTSNKIYAIK